jgi:hypothetical protein
MQRIGLLFLSTLPLFAQCSLTVVVEDASAGRIANASVRLRDQTTSRVLSAASSPDGAATFSAVPCAAYQLTAAFAGFEDSTATVRLTERAPAQLKVTLRTRGLTEQVQIIEGADLLQTNRATQSVALSAQQIQNMPTASRNITHLLVAESGVAAPLPDRTGRGMNLATAPGGQADDGTQSLNPSVNGARPTNNSMAINGLDATNMMNANGGLGNSISVPLDALEMVEMQTALYSASTGRNGGGNISLITRSGTNSYHGSGYHFLQNEQFNANEFFLNRAGTRRPKFRRNETGATFGGRIIRDKTFFFASVQRTDFLSGYAQRAIAATGVPVGLGDTRTRESIAAVANQWLQSGAAGNPAFANNFLTSIRAFPAEQIPGLESKFFSSTAPGNVRLRTLTAQDIHPVAVNVLNQKRDGKFLLPSFSPSMPLLSGNASFGDEGLLQQSFPTFFNSWAGSGSIEHNFSQANRLRLNYIRSTSYVEEAFGWANSSPSPTFGLTPSYTAGLQHTKTFGTQWVSEFRGGFFELFNTRISKYRDISNSALGIFNPLEASIGGLASLMPTIDINTQRSTSGIGNAWDFFDRQRVINVSETVSYTRARHTMQFGGEFRRPTIAGEYMARTNGDLDYGNWALFFTGHGAAGGGSDLDQGDTRRHFKMKDFSMFFQDDWRIRPGLTINLGVRYDYYGNPSDTEGRIGNYYTASTAAALGLPQAGFYVDPKSAFFQPNFDPLKLGIVVEPGTPFNLNGVFKAPWASTIKPDWNNIAPRIGMAWQLTPKLVLRSGYGMFYERTSGAIKTDLQLSAPFFIYQNVPAPVDMADPYPKLNVNPFQIPFNVTIVRNAAGAPSWRRFDGSAFPATSPFSAKNNTFVDPFLRTPYVQQWTMNVQYEPMAGSLVDVRYVGSRGVGLMARLNLAQPVDPRVTPVNGFNNIFTSTGALISPDFFVKPEFLGLNRSGGFRQRSNWGQATYHSMQANFRRRLGKWVTGNFSYTWSKSLDNVSSDGAVIEHDGFNLANNRGLSDFDRTHRFTGVYVIDFPTPQRFKTLLGGWSLSGLMTLQSGSPFTALGNATTNARWAQPARVRPSFVPGRTNDDAVRTGRIQDRLSLFFDPSVFTNSLDAWGDVGRNTLRGPKQVQYDFMLGKTMKIRESYQLEFRWETYNAFNQATFTNPASTLAAAGPGTAGVISSTIGGPRTMQVALRFRF